MADDFFGELGKSISRATQQAVDRTGDFFEKTKITAQITGEQKEIDKLYQRLGEIVYRSIKAGTMMSNPELDPVMNDIDAHLNQVHTFRKSLADVSGMKVCGCCGSLIPLEAAFCPRCGAPAPLMNPEESEKNDAGAVTDQDPQNLMGEDDSRR